MENPRLIRDATYGVTVDVATSTKEVVSRLTHLRRMDVEHVILYSKLPHDARGRADWNQIEEAVKGPFKFSVELYDGGDEVRSLAPISNHTFYVLV